jgi:hypothetical protein
MFFLDRDYPEAHAMLHQSTRFPLLITFPTKMDMYLTCIGSSILKKNLRTSGSLFIIRTTHGFNGTPLSPHQAGLVDHLLDLGSGMWDVG